MAEGATNVLHEPDVVVGGGITRLAARDGPDAADEARPSSARATVHVDAWVLLHQRVDCFERLSNLFWRRRREIGDRHVPKPHSRAFGEPLFLFHDVLRPRPLG